jgi:hypothetical protein
MGEQIWDTGCGKLGQGSTIHFSCVEWPLPQARHSPQSDNIPASTGQWLSGKIPQTTEGSTPGETGEWRLVWPASLGDDEAEGCPKGGLWLSSVEMVYGEPLTLLSEFLEGAERSLPGFTQQLRQKMNDFVPPTTRPQPHQLSSTSHASLLQAEFMYVKRGLAVPSLAPLYAGPYKVVERGEKYFRLDMGGHTEAVSTDWLKPHLGSSPLQPARPPKIGQPLAADFSATAGVGG